MSVFFLVLAFLDFLISARFFLVFLSMLVDSMRVGSGGVGAGGGGTGGGARGKVLAWLRVGGVREGREL